MAGRPPKPTVLKLLEGNPGKRKLNDREPVPKSGRPKRPSWLASNARRYWPSTLALLDDMDVLSVVDGTAVALLCTALAEYVASNTEVEANGLTWLETRLDKDANVVSTALKANPAVAMRADSWRRVNLMLQQFGMTASSRAKIHVQPSEETDEFDKLMRRKKK